ncbi:MAG TPA: bacterial transcriptional activator domain-containing protein [Gemmatimonadota bacterium]|nr:bacterial transcriptional activator domain-containing protein [Gemmatimonadota bacterium]
MKLVGGEFLPGFLYARASSAFLEWVDRERNRLKERSLETSLILAREEERRGNTTGEVHWLKRALELEPFREDLMEQIVDLYERGGNPATAAQAIRSFSRTLRTRYGTSVSPALRHRLRVLQKELVAETVKEDAHQRMHALQQQVSTEMSRTTELMRQLQALTRQGRRVVD